MDRFPEPQWNSDPKTKGLQPKGLPQFEVAGPQTDNDFYQQASRLVFSRFTAILFVLLAIMLFFSLRAAFQGKKSGFAQFKSTESGQVIKLAIRSQGTESVESVTKFFFTAKPRPGHKFVKVKVATTNLGNQEYSLNPYSYGVITRSGAIYGVHLQTRNLDQRLKALDLEPEQRVEGYLLFEIPSSDALATLQLNGGSGPIASAPIR